MGNFIPVEPEKWAEMVKALAEVEQLKAEVERLTNNCDCLDRALDREIDKTAMLCGQVERLRKAGDAMYAIIERVEDNPYGPAPYGYDAMTAWNAAKEGQQS